MTSILVLHSDTLSDLYCLCTEPTTRASWLTQIDDLSVMSMTLHTSDVSEGDDLNAASGRERRVQSSVENGL